MVHSHFYYRSKVVQQQQQQHMYISSNESQALPRCHATYSLLSVWCDFFFSLNKNGDCSKMSVCMCSVSPGIGCCCCCGGTIALVTASDAFTIIDIWLFMGLYCERRFIPLLVHRSFLWLLLHRTWMYIQQVEVCVSIVIKIWSAARKCTVHKATQCNKWKKRAKRNETQLLADALQPKVPYSIIFVSTLVSNQSNVYTERTDQQISDGVRSRQCQIQKKKYFRYIHSLHSLELG